VGSSSKSPKHHGAVVAPAGIAAGAPATGVASAADTGVATLDATPLEPPAPEAAPPTGRVAQVRMVQQPDGTWTLEIAGIEEGEDLA